VRTKERCHSRALAHRCKWCRAKAKCYERCEWKRREKDCNASPSPSVSVTPKPSIQVILHNETTGVTVTQYVASGAGAAAFASVPLSHESLSQSRMISAVRRSDVEDGQNPPGVFVFGGGLNTGNQNPTKNAYVCNATSPWACNAAELSVARCSLSAASTYDIIAFGGGSDTPYVESGVKVFSTVDVYNVTSGVWWNHTLSEARYGLAAAGANGHILFAGGRNSNGDYVNTVDVFQPYGTLSDNGTWLALWTTTTLSLGRTFLTGVSWNDQHVIFGGGENHAGPSNVVDIYNTSSGKWTTAPEAHSMPPAYFRASAAAGPYVLFAGDSDINTQPTSTISVLDVANNVWVPQYSRNLSRPASGLAGASLGDCYALFAGGLLPGSEDSISDVTAFDACQHAYSTAPSLYSAAVGLSGASLGNEAMFCLGVPSGPHCDVYGLS